MMIFKNSLLFCFLFLILQFSYSQNIDKNPPKYNYIKAILSTDGNQKLMEMLGFFNPFYNDASKPAVMQMSFIESGKGSGEQVDPIFFDSLGYVYIKSDEGYIKTFFDTVLFPVIPFLSQADEFKSDVDVELGIDPLPDSWPLLSLVTKYNIGHFEGKDHIAKKDEFMLDDVGLIWTRFSAVDPEHLGNRIAFDSYGRLIMIQTPQGIIKYTYFYSEETLLHDFPMFAKHEPNMGEMMVGLLIGLLGGLGG
jgi:hypothetical protein